MLFTKKTFSVIARDCRGTKFCAPTNNVIVSEEKQSPTNPQSAVGSGQTKQSHTILALLYLTFYFLVCTKINIYSEEEQIKEEASKKEYISAPATLFAAGSDSSLTLEIFGKTLPKVAEKIGITIKNADVQIQSGTEIVTYFDTTKNKKTVTSRIDYLAEMVKQQKIDFVTTDMETYAKIKKKGIPIAPLITMRLGDKITYDSCIYVRKKDGLKNVGELKGKNLSGWAWMSVRKILFDNGFDMPIEKFFGKIEQIDGFHNAWCNALLAKKIDAFSAGALGMTLIFYSNPKNKIEITALECISTPPPFPTIFYRKGINENILNKIKKEFLNIKSDSSFMKIFGFYLMALKWDFKPVEKDWETANIKYEKFLEDAGKRKWTSEKYWQQ